MHINVLLLLQFEKLICKMCPGPNNSDFFFLLFVRVLQ